MRVARLLLLLVLLPMPFASPTPAHAADDSRRGEFFWRGRPLPECSSFLVTEFGAHYLLNLDAQPYRERQLFITVDLGYMKNRNEQSAIGGLIHFGSSGDWTGFGPGVRYRRWLSKDLAADATVGLDVLGSVDPGGEFGAPAPWAEIGFSAADVIAVTLRGQHWTGQIEPIRYDGSLGPKGVTAWHIGAKGGSYLGAAGAVGVVVLIAVVIAALASEVN
ncbi:MAG TPA: hypothetical protein VI198_01220 [Candidatus Eisenbacteria bacterium]